MTFFFLGKFGEDEVIPIPKCTVHCTVTDYDSDFFSGGGGGGAAGKFIVCALGEEKLFFLPKEVAVAFVCVGSF